MIPKKVKLLLPREQWLAIAKAVGGTMCEFQLASKQATCGIWTFGVGEEPHLVLEIRLGPMLSDLGISIGPQLDKVISFLSFSLYIYNINFNFIVLRPSTTYQESNSQMLNIAAYTDYALDIAEAFKHKENQRISFNFQSPELQHRNSLVKCIRYIGENLKLSNTSVHLAVYLLDIFMDHHAIVPERLSLVTLVSLLLATKIEETDLNVPKISKLNAFIGNKYPTSDFVCLEVMMLQFVGWNLILPTPAHFAEYYAVFAVTPSDFRKTSSRYHKMSSRFDSYQQLKHCSHQYIKDYLDQSLTEINMHHFHPSVVAAACIAVTRQRLQIYPTWSSKLLSVTEYNLQDLQSCINTLLCVESSKSCVSKRKLPESPDHGYESGQNTANSPEPFSHKRGCYDSQE